MRNTSLMAVYLPEPQSRVAGSYVVQDAVSVRSTNVVFAGVSAASGTTVIFTVAMLCPLFLFSSN
jgi:hypothetical protein